MMARGRSKHFGSNCILARQSFRISSSHPNHQIGFTNQNCASGLTVLGFCGVENNPTRLFARGKEPTRGPWTVFLVFTVVGRKLTFSLSLSLSLSLMSRFIELFQYASVVMLLSSYAFLTIDVVLTCAFYLGVPKAKTSLPWNSTLHACAACKPSVLFVKREARTCLQGY